MLHDLHPAYPDEIVDDRRRHRQGATVRGGEHVLGAAGDRADPSERPTARAGFVGRRTHLVPGAVAQQREAPVVEAGPDDLPSVGDAGDRVELENAVVVEDVVCAVLAVPGHHDAFGLAVVVDDRRLEHRGHQRARRSADHLRRGDDPAQRQGAAVVGEQAGEDRDARRPALDGQRTELVDASRIVGRCSVVRWKLDTISCRFPGRDGRGRRRCRRRSRCRAARCGACRHPSRTSATAAPVRTARRPTTPASASR